MAPRKRSSSKNADQGPQRKVSHHRYGLRSIAKQQAPAPPPRTAPAPVTISVQRAPRALARILSSTNLDVALGVANAKKNEGRQSSSRPATASPSVNIVNLGGRPKCHISERVPQRSFDDIVGVGYLKQKLLKSVIAPFIALPENRAFFRISAPRGVLLAGPPGTGKTALADCIVNRIRARGVNVRYFQEVGSCLSKYIGDTEKNLRELFKRANAAAPSVILLDDFDGLGQQRTGGMYSAAMTTVITTLLAELQNVERGRVLVIAATNCLDHMDAALKRPGRFDRIYSMELPDEEQKLEILQLYLRKMNLEIQPGDQKVIVKKLEQCTGCDLEEFVQQLQEEKISKYFPDEEWGRAPIKDLQKKFPEGRIPLDLKQDVEPVLVDFMKQMAGAKSQRPGN